MSRNSRPLRNKGDDIVCSCMKVQAGLNIRHKINDLMRTLKNNLLCAHTGKQNVFNFLKAHSSSTEDREMLIRTILTSKDPVNPDPLQYTENKSSAEVLQAFLRSIGLDLQFTDGDDMPDDGEL